MGLCKFLYHHIDFSVKRLERGKSGSGETSQEDITIIQERGNQESDEGGLIEEVREEEDLRVSWWYK